MSRERIESCIVEAVQRHLVEYTDSCIQDICYIHISEDYKTVIVSFVEDIAFYECEVLSILSGRGNNLRIGLKLVAWL